jgi:hypothetical protein
MTTIRVFLSLVLLSLISLPSFAKGATLKITIDNEHFTTPIEIVDTETLRNFQVFAGAGTSSNEPHSLIVDWTTGTVSPPPVNIERYRVSFYVEHYASPYVVLYAYDPRHSQGYVYLPGREDPWYRSNVSIIIRRVEGNWLPAWAVWEHIARPLIEAHIRSYSVRW